MPNEPLNLSQVVNNLIDEDGLKTEVMVTLTDETMRKLGYTIVLSAGGAAFLVFMIKGIFKLATR